MSPTNGWKHNLLSETQSTNNNNTGVSVADITTPDNTIRNAAISGLFYCHSQPRLTVKLQGNSSNHTHRAWWCWVMFFMTVPVLCSSQPKPCCRQNSLLTWQQHIKGARAGFCRHECVSVLLQEELWDAASCYCSNLLHPHRLTQA